MTSTTRGLLASYSLARRELVRFVRQRNRVLGALAQPVAFWAIFGAGLSPSFRPTVGEGSVGYMEYFFPGTVVLVLLLTAIFATISIIEDRKEGFLQSVLVAPLPSFAIVTGKLAGTTLLAVVQAVAVFVLAPVAGIELDAVAVAAALPLLALIAMGLTGLGFSIAWQSDSTQGFHAVMTAFLMPMWFLSGSFFPASDLPAWLAWVIVVNPLTYGVAALRHVLYLGQPEAVVGLPSLSLSLAITAAFAIASFAVALWVVSHRRPGPETR